MPKKCICLRALYVNTGWKSRESSRAGILPLLSLLPSAQASREYLFSWNSVFYCYPVPLLRTLLWISQKMLSTKAFLLTEAMSFNFEHYAGTVR